MNSTGFVSSDAFPMARKYLACDCFAQRHIPHKTIVSLFVGIPS